MFGSMRKIRSEWRAKTRGQGVRTKPIDGDRDVPGDPGRRFGQILHDEKGAMPINGDESF
jgi:hypothetical protein